MRKKNRLTILCLLMSLIFTACIEDTIVVGSISGIVTDYLTNVPLEGASVTLSPLGKNLNTGTDGHYEFINLSAQEYTVMVSKANYKTEKKNVFVEVGKNNKLDISLHPSQPELQVQQKTLDFGNDATTLTLDIKNVGTATMNWSISEDVSWLSCVPTSGSIISGGSASVVVNVDRQGMGVGNHSQTLVVTSDGGSAVIVVNMSVQGMSVTVSPQELDFGNTTSALTLTMSGGDNISYTLTPSNDWIIPGKTSGVFSKTENVVVAVERANHSEGNYTGHLLLRVGEHSKEIPVRMMILPEALPSISLLSVDEITDAAATFAGAVISVGSSRIVKHGFCWSKLENPDITTAENCNFGDCGEAKNLTYTANLLEENSVYYVRAYAENSVGVSYSNQLRFRTNEAPCKPVVETGSVASIRASQADVYGKILKVGHSEGITQYGHAWARTVNPTIDNTHTELGSLQATSSFLSTITELEPNTTYHVRAYATNSIGTSYGEDITFTTATDIVTLTTTAAYDIIHNEAMVGGSISYDGGNTIVERGVCWGIDKNPTISNDKAVSNDISTRFNVRIKGLTELTSYHARAYVLTAEDKVFYGNDIMFTTTHEIHLPQSAITTIGNIGTTSATFYSSITSDGDGNISDCGFCYSRVSAPTVEDSKVSLGKRTSTLVATVKELTENTTYYVRSYVVNEAGIAYGEEGNFATLEILPPTLSAITIGSLTHRSASFSAQILSANNGTIIDAGFVYSTNPNPGLTNHKITCGTSLSLSGRANSLLPNTIYYVRAYATNEKGTAFSEDFCFTTKEEPEGSNIEVDEGYENENNWD